MFILFLLFQQVFIFDKIMMRDSTHGAQRNCYGKSKKKRVTEVCKTV